MKITRNTPEQLIVGETPWFLGIGLIFFIICFVGPGLAITFTGEPAGLLFALLGGGLGIGAFAVFVRRIQVILDKGQGSITMRERSLFGYSEVRHDLSNLAGAVIETTTGSKGSTLYRPVLVLDKGMSKGRHPISEIYTNGRGPHRLVEAVNSWLPASEAFLRAS